MRFLLDMGLSPQTARFLRALGHDAVHLRDRQLQQMRDEQIFDLAADEARVVVTCDLDFGHIVARFNRARPSLILFRLPKYTTEQINALLAEVIRLYGAALDSGAVVVVDEARVRVRPLPITP